MQADSDRAGSGDWYRWSAVSHRTGEEGRRDSLDSARQNAPAERGAGRTGRGIGRSEQGIELLALPQLANEAQKTFRTDPRIPFSDGMPRRAITHLPVAPRDRIPERHEVRRAPSVFSRPKPPLGDISGVLADEHGQPFIEPGRNGAPRLKISHPAA